MAFPREFLDELISRSDIVDVVSSYVALTKKGGNYFGLCPFHNEKTGAANAAPVKYLFYCLDSSFLPASFFCSQSLPSTKRETI